MIVLTEDQVVLAGYKLIDFLSECEETKDLTVAEWISVLGTATFLLGKETDERLEY